MYPDHFIPHARSPFCFLVSNYKMEGSVSFSHTVPPFRQRNLDKMHHFPFIMVSDVQLNYNALLYYGVAGLTDKCDIVTWC